MKVNNHRPQFTLGDEEGGRTLMFVLNLRTIALGYSFELHQGEWQLFIFLGPLSVIAWASRANAPDLTEPIVTFWDNSPIPLWTTEEIREWGTPGRRETPDFGSPEFDPAPIEAVVMAATSERERDLLLYGTSVEVDGKRVDPTRVIIRHGNATLLDGPGVASPELGRNPPVPVEQRDAPVMFHVKHSSKPVTNEAQTPTLGS